MAWTIRSFCPDDYGAVVALWSTVYPEDAMTVARWRYADEQRYRDKVCGRWVAEQDGRIVGLGQYDQYGNLHVAGLYRILVVVRPGYRRQGIGGALYELAEAGLRAHQPVAARTRFVPVTATDSIRFLTKRGFREYWRMWESHLAVASFDPTPFAGIEAALRKQGIVIKTLTDLASDPQCTRKLYQLEREAAADAPTPEPLQPLTFEQYVVGELNAPDTLPDAFFVALHGDEYVGMSFLRKTGDGLDIDTTAVKRSYRRQGIATALKLRGIAYARNHGYGVICTWNDTANHAILALNERLGFVRQPAVLLFRKDF